MDRDLSDALFPFGIGASFVITLLALMLLGSVVGFLLAPFLAQEGFVHGGGIVLLVIFLVTIVFPIAYNRRISRFERQRTPLCTMDHFGTIHGLRGTFIRLLVYDDGLEIRAFYHRYFIPFDRIEDASIERLVFGKRLAIKTSLKGAPEFLALPDKELSDLVSTIKRKLENDQTGAHIKG
jgi:hypothetical protein